MTADPHIENLPGPASSKKPIGQGKFRLRMVREIMQPPQEIQQVSRAKASSGESCQWINLITANLWHDFPRYKDINRRLESFTELASVARVDVLLLQEAARTPALHASEWIAHQLGMHYVYAPSNGHPAIGFEEGLAVVSRFPLSNPMLRRLGGASRRSFVHRIALRVTVDTPCGNLQVFSVHLGLAARQNYHQLRDLAAWVAETDPEVPVVIGGDFNAAEDSPQIRHARHHWIDTFRKVNPHEDASTHSLRWPWGGIIKRHRLDYVFFRDSLKSWQVLDARHLKSASIPHSDHHAVFTQISPAPVL